MHVPGVKTLQEQTTESDTTLGIHERTGLKVVCSSHSCDDPQQAVQSSRTIIAAYHPNLLPLLDVHRTDDALVLVHQYAQTLPLSSASTPSHEQGWTWLSAGLGALGAIHTLGALHGAVDDQSVRVTADGRLILTRSGTPHDRALNYQQEIGALIEQLSVVVPADSPAGAFLGEATLDPAIAPHQWASDLGARALDASKVGGQICPSSTTPNEPDPPAGAQPPPNYGQSPVPAPTGAPDRPIEVTPALKPQRAPRAARAKTPKPIKTKPAKAPKPVRRDAGANKVMTGPMWIAVCAAVLVIAALLAVMFLLKPAPKTAPSTAPQTSASSPTKTAPLTAEQLTVLKGDDAAAAMRELLTIRNRAYVEGNHEILDLALFADSQAKSIERQIIERDQGAKHPGMNLIVDSLTPISVTPTSAIFDVRWHTTAHTKIAGSETKEMPDRDPVQTRIRIAKDGGRWWTVEYVNADTGP